MVEGLNNKFRNNLLMHVHLRDLPEAEGVVLNWAALGNFASPTNYFALEHVEISGNVG
jgi:hypothetical protein